MLLQIDHHSGIPIYRQVVDQIRSMILARQLEPEGQLTSVRELAVQLRVNPMTVSKAYSQLEAVGLVERRRGVGLFVANLGAPKQGQAKDEILKEILQRAVTTAVQMDIPLDQVQATLTQLYEKIHPEKRRGES